MFPSTGCPVLAGYIAAEGLPGDSRQPFSGDPFPVDAYSVAGELLQTFGLDAR
jgi:hypothetical protein